MVYLGRWITCGLKERPSLFLFYLIYLLEWRKWQEGSNGAQYFSYLSYFEGEVLSERDELELRRKGLGS